MAKEAFDLIKESEAKADDILQDAKQKTKAIVVETQSKIDDIASKYHGELAELRKETEKVELEKRIKQEAEIDAQTEATKNELQTKLASKKDELSKYIIEVVLKQYGGC